MPGLESIKNAAKPEDNAAILYRLVVNFLDLKSVELNCSFATKHGNENFELTLVGVNFGNRTFEALEWTIDNGDNLAG